MKNLQTIKEYSEKAYDFLINFNKDNYKDGRYDFEDGLFVNIITYKTNFRENQKYEAHKNYIDVQYIIEGKEGFCIEPVEKIDKSLIIHPYNEDNDIMFFSNEIKGDYYILNEGEFLIMEPDMAHMPSIAVNDIPLYVRKMVIKIPVK